MPESIDIVIVGGGVIGCALALKASSLYDEVFLFEKNQGITKGENQSTRNSGVIHSGIYYDRKTRPNKAELCVKGNGLIYDFCHHYNVPAIKSGKLIVATNDNEEETLDFYLKRAHENGVPGANMISGSKVIKLEPNVKAKSALLIPTAGIIEPVSLMYRMHTLAEGAGVRFILNTEVTGFNKCGNDLLVEIRYPDGKRDDVLTRTVINAGGINSIDLARVLNNNLLYELDPMRGESLKFYSHKRPELNLARYNVYPTPEMATGKGSTHFTVGVHLTPTFKDLSWPPSIGNTVTVGPKLTPAYNKDNEPTDEIPVASFLDKISSFFPGLTERDLSRHQAGVQARLKGYPDFVFDRTRDFPNVINLLGIDSPGLTSCMAIADKVFEMIKEAGL